MIEKLMTILVSALIIADLYIYFMFINRYAVALPVKLLYFLPTLLIIAGMLYLARHSGTDFFYEHNREVGWFFVFYFFITIPKLLFFLFSLLGIPFRMAGMHFPYLDYVGGALGLTVAFIIAFGFFAGKTKFDLKEVTFTSPDLPAGFDGYRIVQLADIHIGSWKGNEKALERAVELINAQQADVVLFIGDLINNLAKELDGFQEILSRITAREGVYSVMGNHDYGPYYPWKSKRDEALNITEVRRRQKEMGWILLDNEHVILRHRGDSIALVGVENDGEPPFSQYADLPKALRGTEGMFKILMSHNPTHWTREVYPQSDVQLMLAGHTHAMQLAIGHHSPSSFVYPQWGGMYLFGERGLYVNVGLGFVGLPFRFGAWPEITVLTLKKE